MYKLLTKNGQLLALILGVAVIAIFFIGIFSGLSSAGYSTGDDLNAIMKNNPDADLSFFNFGIMAAAGMAVVALIAAVGFGLFQMLTNLKGSMKGIIAFAAILILFFVLYSTSGADTSIVASLVQKFDVPDNVSKMISGGIKTTSIMALLAFGIGVVMEILNMFK